MAARMPVRAVTGTRREAQQHGRQAAALIEVARVEFYANDALVRTDANAPHSVLWRPEARGTYNLTAVAVDDRGATVRSAAVAVTVK